jgi:hypothetical protein
MNAPTPPPQGPHYPGGEDNPAYRWAFNAYAALFLLTLSLGLLNFLGSYLKAQMTQ